MPLCDVEVDDLAIMPDMLFALARLIHTSHPTGSHKKLFGKREVQGSIPHQSSMWRQLSYSLLLCCNSLHPTVLVTLTLDVNTFKEVLLTSMTSKTLTWHANMYVHNTQIHVCT